MTTVNIVLGSGTNAVIIETNKVEEIQSNQIISITPPSNTTLQDTLVVDLLRVQIRFNVDGKILYADRTKFRNLMSTRGLFLMKYDAEGLGPGNEQTFNVIFEKFQITEVPRGEHDQGLDPKYLTIKFSVLKAESYESS